MKVYYDQDNDRLLVYLGKSSLDWFYRYQFEMNAFYLESRSPKNLVYIGEL